MHSILNHISRLLLKVTGFQYPCGWSARHITQRLRSLVDEITMLQTGAPLLLFLVAALALERLPRARHALRNLPKPGARKRAGIVSALGIGVGTLVYTIVTALGLSALLLSLPILFNAIRYAGALYLAYLGFRMLFAKVVKTRGASEVTPVHMPLRSVFRQGVTTKCPQPEGGAFLPSLPSAVRGPIERPSRTSTSPVGIDVRYLRNERERASGDFGRAREGTRLRNDQPSPVFSAFCPHSF